MIKVKLIYEIKSILKHKISYVCLGILLLVNLFSMIDLERSNLMNTDEDMIHDYEYTIYQQQVYFENNQLNDLGTDFTPVQQKHLMNYEAYTQWKIQNLVEQVDIIRELPKSASRDQQVLLINLKNTLMLMNVNAVPEQGDAYAEEVFKAEIKQFEQELGLDNIPFESQSLYLQPYMNMLYSPGLRHEMYLSNSINARYCFELLQNNLAEINFSSVSPWGFLAKQLSRDSLLPFTIFPMCLIFSFVYLMDSKLNRSLNLLLTMPVKRQRVITLQFVALLIAFILIIAFSFAIPILILGIRHGWNNFNSPIFVDPNSFNSLQIYSHADEPWMNFGLSYLPSAQSIQENGLNFYFSPNLEFWKLPSVLFYTIGLFVSKMTVALSMGLLSAYVFTKSWKSYMIVSLLIMFYIMCQTVLNGFMSMVNIFDLGACFTITQGSGNVTWLNAMILTISVTFVLFLLTSQSFKRKDV